MKSLLGNKLLSELYDNFNMLLDVDAVLDPDVFTVPLITQYLNTLVQRHGWVYFLDIESFEIENADYYCLLSAVIDEIRSDLKFLTGNSELINIRFINQLAVEIEYAPSKPERF